MFYILGKDPKTLGDTGGVGVTWPLFVCFLQLSHCFSSLAYSAWLMDYLDDLLSGLIVCIFLTVLICVFLGLMDDKIKKFTNAVNWLSFLNQCPALIGYVSQAIAYQR